MFKEAEHSQLYLKYRPKYPDNVYRLFADKLKESYERLPENQRGIGVFLYLWRIANLTRCVNRQIPHLFSFNISSGLRVLLAFRDNFN